MADININPEDLNQDLGPFNSGTTDLNSFLPFQGADLNYPKVNTPAPIDKLSPGNNLDNQMYPIKDYITGLPPYLDKQSTVGKMTAQQKANAIASYTYNTLNAYQDDNAYAKIQSYDPSSNGAHRARYLAYGQETFDKVGFNPLINNEALFNANTSVLDDMSRMMASSFFPLFGRGAIANPKSYAGLFTGDFGQDVAEAAAYEDAHAIGYSSKGGLGAFVNNTLNSFAYTAGILVEAAAEEALIGAAIGSRGGPGGAAGGAAIGGGAGILKGLFQLPKALASMTKNGATVLANLRNLDKVSEARTAFNAASRKVGDFLNPAENITNLLRADNAITNYNNIGKLARAKNTFAGFYLDIRNMNMALSEGRLEGGFVENNTYKQLYDEHYANFGMAPDNDKQREFRQIAKQAGADATMYNSALIFYSNKVVFPTIMRGSMLRNMSKHYTENIIDLGGKAKVILTKEGFEGIQTGLKASLKALKNPLTYGRSAAGYFKVNVMEGLQESFQDVIADYTQKRYTEAYYEPAKMTYDYKKGLLKDALLKQISPQGFETFASGFVMGGYSKVLTGGYHLLSDSYTKYVGNPKGYADYIKERKETAESIANRLNQIYENPGEFFKNRYFNYGHQVLISKAQDSEDTTQKEMMDTTDDSFITNLTTILQTNTMHHFTDNLQKLKGLTAEELEKELSLAPGEGQKALERIDTIISRAKRMQKRYDAASKLQSGIDLNQFKEGTDEYRKMALLDEAFKVSKANLIFFGESFDRNLERIQNISEEVLNLTNQSQKIKASDVMALTSNDRLKNEINILKTDIESLTGITDPEAKKELAKATEKLEALQKIQESFAALDPADFTIKVANELLQTLDEEATEEEVKTLMEENFAEKSALMAKEIVEDIKSSTIDYLKKIIDDPVEYNLFISKLNSQDGINSIDSLITSLVDIHKLDSENAALASASTTLSDPEEFLEHVNRNFTWMEDMYRNRKEYFKDVVNTSIEQKEQNDLLEKLAEKGIYVDLNEFAAWIEDKSKIPTQFEDDINKKIITQDTPLYKEYASMFLQLADIQSEKPAGEKLDQDELLKERISEEDTKMQQELDEARKEYDKDLKEEIGYTEQELKDAVSEVTDTSKIEEDLEELQSYIDELTETAYTDESSLEELAVLIERISDAELFSTEDVTNKVVELTKDKEKVKKVTALFQANTDIKLKNAGEEGKLFAFNKAAALEVLEEKAKPLQDQLSSATEAPDVDVENTEAKKKYDAKVKEINERYKTIKDDLVKEFGKKGAKAKDVTTAKKYEKITTTTPWYELPNDLREELETLFQEYKKAKKISKDTDEGTLDLLRQKWLESQGAVIEAYNNTKAGEVETEEEITTEPPVLTLKPTTPETLTTMNLEELKALADDINKIITKKKYYDPKDKKLKDLSKAQLDKGKKELKALKGYIAYRRSIAGIPTPEQEVVDVIDNLIKGAEANVELIKDKDGNLIGRRIKGTEYGKDEYAERVTTEKERILKETDPTYKGYIYPALQPKEEINKKTGRVEQTPSTMELIFNRALATVSEEATKDEKVESFISQLKKAFVSKDKGSIKKFGVEWKYDEIRNYFKDADFNYDNVYEIISKLANREASLAGTQLDKFGRDYLSGKKITRPQNISESAWKNFVGILDKLLDKVKDGTYTLIPKDLLLYDKEYDSNRGLVGETDLILVDKDGNYFIVDFKTGSSSTWSYFNKEAQTIDLTEPTKWAREDTPEIGDVTAINWEDLGFESYEDFNMQYDNDIAGISLLETKGPNSKGDIKGTIVIYFKKGSGKKAADLNVTFTKGSYVNEVKFSTRPGYAIQLTFYRNLFNNLTGIMPKGLKLVPFEIVVNEEREIQKITLAPIADQETGLLDVEPMEVVNDYLPLKESVAPSEEPTQEIKPTGTINVYWGQAESKTSTKILSNLAPRTFTWKGREYGSVEHAYQSNKSGTFDQITYDKYVSAGGYGRKIRGKSVQKGFDNLQLMKDLVVESFVQNPNSEAAKKLLQYENFTHNTNEIIDKAFLEGLKLAQQRLLPSQPQGSVTDDVEYEEYTPKSYDIEDNIGKTVLYQGEIGKLIRFQKGYGIETDSAIYYLDTENETNILNLGINTIKLNPGLFNNPVVNGTVYTIEKVDQDTVTINGIEYIVQRNKKGGVKSLQYRSNDEAIINKRKEIEQIQAKLKAEVTDKLKGSTKEQRAILRQKETSINYKLEVLEGQLDELINNNKPVITRNKELIAAVQSLPESFNNSNSPEDEENDLDEIKKNSDNSAAIQDMYDILQENMPQNFDKLITDISSLTKSDLTNFISYSNEVISKLEDLKAYYEGKGNLTTNISREINVFKELLNYITNLELTKNGKVRKTKVNQERQERLQQDVNESAIQESESRETGPVSKQKAKRGARKVNNTILQPLIFKLLQETAESEVEEQIETEEDLVTIEDIKELFDTATPDTLDEIYFDVLKAIKDGKINLPNTKFIDNLKQAKEKEFSTKVTLKSLNVNDTLLTKTKNEIWRVKEVLTDGVEIIKDQTGDVKFISTEEIAKSYLKFYKNMPIPEETIEVDESDMDASTETSESLDEVFEDDEAKKAMLDELSKLSKEERRARLKKNNKCD